MEPIFEKIEIEKISSKNSKISSKFVRCLYINVAMYEKIALFKTATTFFR